MDHKGPKKGNQESFTNRRIFIIDHLIEDRKKDKGSLDISLTTDEPKGHLYQQSIITVAFILSKESLYL